jgi:hypothetical protein
MKFGENGAQWSTVSQPTELRATFEAIGIIFRKSSKNLLLLSGRHGREWKWSDLS